MDSFAKVCTALRRDLDVVMGTKAEEKKVDKVSQEKTTKSLIATQQKGFGEVAEKIAKDFCAGDKNRPDTSTLPSKSSSSTKTSIFDDVNKPNIFNTQTKPPMLFNQVDPPQATSKKDGAIRKSGVMDTKMQTLLDISPALVPFAEETFGSSTLVDPGPWREKFVIGGGG
ncbi:unnamed protein product [Amoebophrya sp. A120]|nr:unnamed protein product [Amoebophrya sp. A120]|eukprot:GSA120T00001306001.1